ncbi:hypothetical protein FRC17_010079 [Serendipita sp. 399]|nr:hypothetical protein FRC17_010079 [Serendipita sp. 399]
MSNLHQLTLKWPAGPSKVVVTGTFDDWARTKLLTKTDTGFEITLSVPWNGKYHSFSNSSLSLIPSFAEKTTYKYVVDGEWAVSSAAPQERDWRGNINNYYISPPSPAQLAPQPPASPAAEQTKSTVQTLADSAIAANGAPSITSYVASGIGAAIATVTGYDPVNPQHIPVEESPAPVQNTTEQAKPAPTIETIQEPVHPNGDATIPTVTVEEDAAPLAAPPTVAEVVAAEPVVEPVGTTEEPAPASAPAPIPVPDAPEPYPAVNGNEHVAAAASPAEPPSTAAAAVACAPKEEETTPAAPKSETKELTPRNSTASPPRASSTLSPPTTPQRKKTFSSEDTASSITDSPSKRKKRLSFFGKIKEVLTPEKKHHHHHHKKSLSSSS